MVTQRKPTKKPALVKRTPRSPQKSGNVASKPVAARTEAPTTLRPRFALNAPKIERFFERAIVVGSVVTLTKRDGTKIEGATPIGILPTGYRVKLTRTQTVPKDSVARIDTAF